MDNDLPDIDFSTFILSLSNSAVLCFGETEDPNSGKKEVNLPAAKQTIDIITILKEKTAGNLTEDEEKLLKSILYELQVKYASLVEKGS